MWSTDIMSVRILTRTLSVTLPCESSWYGVTTGTLSDLKFTLISIKLYSFLLLPSF
uniref:Uncharacterized protein n=1 Tax=Amphimedon queenslandica TaxID=400682 RepID=A0A1X7UK47_AMPQE